MPKPNILSIFFLIYQKTLTFDSFLFAVPPRFIRRPQNVRAHEKSVVEHQCDIYGVPKPKITWMKDGITIEEKDYLQFVNNKHLKILGLLDIDQGIYQCFGENELGSIQGEAQLIVVAEGELSPLKKFLISVMNIFGLSNDRGLPSVKKGMGLSIPLK